MKRISALILALLLALTLLGCAPAAEEPSASSPDASPDAAAGEDAQPAQDGGLNTDELYTVEVFSMAANYAGIQPGWFGKILKDKFNMEHNIVATNLEGGDSKLATLMASGDMGDLVIFGDNSVDTIKNAIDAGLLLDWQDNGLLETYGQTFLTEFPEALEYNKAMFGGGEHIYGIGYNVSYDDEGPNEGIDMIWGPYIRWDLYEQLGCPEVESLEDFLPILKQMQELCPTSDTGKPTYAFSMWSDWDNTHMMFAKQYGCMQGYNDGDTGNLLFIHGSEPKYESFLEDGGMYYRSLKLLFDANQMGLVDPDSISQKNADFNAKIQDGQVLFSYFSWVTGYNTPEHTSQGKGMYMVPFKNEKVYSYSQSTYGGIRTTCIGSKAKDPARLMDFLNWVYSDEGTMVYNNGPEGMAWVYGDDGQPELTELGVEIYNNSMTEIPEEWGGGAYSDGSPKFSPGTVTNTTVSKVTGVPFLNQLWPSVLEMDSNPVLNDWREHFGVTTPREYFEQNDMLSIYKVPFLPDGARVMSQDLEQKKSTIGQVVQEYSWRMVFAADEAEFNALWDEMTEKADGLGYQELLAWTIEGAEEEFAARENPLP